MQEARTAAARPDAVLPALTNRKDSWDEGKFQAALKGLLAHRDFDKLHAGEPELAADMVEQWRKALDSVACISCQMHSPGSRCDLAASFVRAVTVCWSNEQAPDTSSPAALRSSCTSCKHTYRRSSARCRAQWVQETVTYPDMDPVASCPQAACRVLLRRCTHDRRYHDRKIWQKFSAIRSTTPS